MSLTRSIFVRTSFVGFHAWPDAPEVVGYLRSEHRHVFGVEVRVDVAHSDRHVEYHMLLEDVARVIDLIAHAAPSGHRLLGSRSCEMLAESIGQLLSGMRYSVRSVQVDEDGENGSLVESFG